MRRLRLVGPALVALAVALVLPACTSGRTEEPGRRVIVLGFDGMDYALTARLIGEGRLPNFARLAEQGLFRPLETAVPPQSPVAWSDFISGLDSGGHGIFDFMHRDPATLVPYLSTSRTEKPRRKPLKLFGRWKIPLAPERYVLLRHGPSFWEPLARRGIPATIVRIPANFPPSGTAERELSGMGTPDLLGSYGIFSLYTTDAGRFPGGRVAGGRIYPVTVDAGVVRAELHGPLNPFLVKKSELTYPFEVYLDPDRPAVELVVGDERVLLQEGEWSEWIQVRFRMFPTQYLTAICRFYLMRVRPTFELYVTPLNVDPLEPAFPVSHPSSFAAELARATGRFYTQGMPEDTKAITEGVFNRDEFLSQARLAGGEVLRQYDVVLSRFRRGLLFYYFGNVDQVSHILWKTMDPEHPAYDPVRDPDYADVIPRLYEQMDAVVGRTLETLGPDDLLIVMSDHGFTSWRRSFDLNAWLRDNGYLAVRDPYAERDPGFLANVDWSRTRAYALGLNGLYINVAGREKYGIVPASEREALVEEIAAKLLAVIDPATGRPAITRVYRRDRYYRDRGYLELGPDLIVGYAKGTRTSNASATGEVMGEVFSDNLDPWSGDHCMDHRAVPGILLASRPLRREATSLKTLAAAILAEFGIEQYPPTGERR